MKTFSCGAILLAFVGLLLFGCSDKEQSPVGLPEQSTQAPASLKKATTPVKVTSTHRPIGFLDPGKSWQTPGGILVLKKVGIREKVVSTDPLVAGTMDHYLSATMDANGEGPVTGQFTLTPEGGGGGYWEGTYVGYRSLTNPDEFFSFTLPLTVVARGRGGKITGMKLFLNDIIRAHGTPPSAWYGTCEGFYK